MSGQSDIDRVREETDLVRLIGEHVALRAQGREHVGVCPFHDDHRPSMHVVTHKEHAFYKCFSCGASGDCFRFVMEYHKMDFGEALRYLADRAGVTLQPRGAGGVSGGPSRGDLRDVTATAHAFFRRTLAEAREGSPARDALRDRGLTPEAVETFEIGLAPPGFDGFLRSLHGDATRIKQAATAGLLRERAERGGFYDTFRNRLIFPIFDELGRPIAFGGRVLDADDTPKYLNSPESPLFDKSKSVFGLHLAKRAILASRSAIVTEGYTDVIACHGAGFTNAVATLGTALTRQHAEVLQRLCDTVTLVFDGDEAGRRAADRAVEVFFAAPVDIRICSLPDNLDPDELLRGDDGPARFAAALERAPDALTYKLDRFGGRLADEIGISGRQKQIQTFLRELADLGFGAMDGVRKRLVLTRLGDLLRMPIADIERAMPAPAASRTSTPAVTTEVRPISDETGDRVPRAVRMAERGLISVILFAPPTAALDEVRDELEPDTFEDPSTRSIVEHARAMLDEAGQLPMQQLLARLPNEMARMVASQLYFDGQRACDDDEAAAAEVALRAVTDLRDCREREDYMRQAGTPTTDAVDTNALLEEIRRRQELPYLPAAITRGARS